MLSIFKRTSRPPMDLRGLACDMHSHLIPGIDDGSPDLETSIELIRGLAGLGYKKLITTPHINQDFFPNTPENIGAGRTAVMAELRRQQLAVEFHAAAEYLLDDGFAGRLSAGEPLLTLTDKMVLIELSFAVPAMNIKDSIFELQLQGYQPVLAHPERYLYFAAAKGWYDQLRDAGCLFQLNLLSFTGHYGREARDLAHYLVKKKYVEFLGTDLHHQGHLEIIRSSEAIFRAVQQLLDAGLIRNPTL
ncbi:MAG TPA: CpsB/CapC family capsule biosynthesis tyrosine phosphatase [Puia sp.]|nr:CpsB/CapC family capsule biosynthesis tyrosine phosphatase [Puia sp.]